MIKTLITAATASVIATATPALAEGRAQPSASAVAPVAAPVAATPVSDAVAAPTPALDSRRRYCVVETMTGSRLPTRVCRTRAEWQATGFDPLVK